MPDNAILVDEGLTSSRQMIALRPHRDRYGYHALASGGIGWGLPASVGVSLANPERPVVCYSGDGSSMYSIQSLWTAANHKLPLTFVIVNNGGYRIIKQRLLAFHGDDNYVGMDFIDPPVDFTGVGEIARAGSDEGDRSRAVEVGIVIRLQPPRREADRGGGEQFGELMTRHRDTVGWARSEATMPTISHLARDGLLGMSLRMPLPTLRRYSAAAARGFTR